MRKKYKHKSANRKAQTEKRKYKEETLA